MLNSTKDRGVLGKKKATRIGGGRSWPPWGGTLLLEQAKCQSPEVAKMNKTHKRVCTSVEDFYRKRQLSEAIFAFPRPSTCSDLILLTFVGTEWEAKEAIFLLLNFFVILDLQSARSVSFADVRPAIFDLKFTGSGLCLPSNYADLKSKLVMGPRTRLPDLYCFSVPTYS